MPKEHEKIEYLPEGKSSIAPFIVYVDLECLIEKIFSCQNNPKNSYTEKKAKHKPSSYVRSLICSFDDTKNNIIFIGERIALKSFVKI